MKERINKYSARNFRRFFVFITINQMPVNKFDTAQEKTALERQNLMIHFVQDRNNMTTKSFRESIF